jgi:hypothetical protein
MGFLKRFFNRERPESPDMPLKLNLPEFEERLDKRLIENKDNVLKKSIPRIKEILNQNKIAIEIVEDLKELDFDEDIKDRTYRPIITSKPVYVRGMLEGLKGIKDREPQSFEELKTFNSNLAKALKSIQSVQQTILKKISQAFQRKFKKLKMQGSPSPI